MTNQVTKDKTDVGAGLQRFLLLLPEDKGVDLTILKGHLLIEELMSDIIVKSLDGKNPLGIKVGQRMMFHEKLKLCWALNRDSVKDEVWEWLQELNKIRNLMAHTVEPVGVSERVGKLRNQVISHSKLSNMIVEGKELGFALAWLYIMLCQILHERENL